MSISATPADQLVDPLTLLALGEVEFQSEMDDHVCPECDEFDGERYDFDDDTKPLLPIHPNCRCFYIYVPTGEEVSFPGSEWAGY